MNQPNPYATPPTTGDENTPVDILATDALQMQQMARELQRIKTRPPTPMRLLRDRSGTVLVFAIAFCATAIVLYLLPPSLLRLQLTVLFVGFCLGFVVRDLLYLRHIAGWQRRCLPFIDWKQVARYASESH